MSTAIANTTGTRDLANSPTICVFCASVTGEGGAHIDAARSLASALHNANASLVYGGGTSGLMGEVAGNLVKLSGPGSVHGVTTRHFMVSERASETNHATNGEQAAAPLCRGELTVVEDLNARKKMMVDMVTANSSSNGGFVALSGGFGTLDEVVHVIKERELGRHKKKVVLVNVDGHWDHIFAWTRDAKTSGFVRASTMEWVLEAKSAEEAVRMLMN